MNNDGLGRRRIDPLRELGGRLLDVEKPARYAGGEYGLLAKKDAALQTLIAFPDLYEIGMSNQALRILYNRLNRIPDISCDRAFAPAPDFEKLLREKGLPLYGLDTGISLKSLDLLMFTLGYELGINGVLTMMDVSDIPIHSAGRGEGDPIVIAGGPAVSNPLPYASFIDAFWIGEAEAGFFDLAAELLELSKRGEGRGGLLEKIAAHPNVWVSGKERAVRAVDFDFSKGEGEAAVFPVPSMKIVQHHGAVEIMRGCPNGCRFCHAGFWYRPMRQKERERVISEADAFISRGGYREISLSSLSSGDYSGIGELIDALNSRFRGRYISFQLPSLRVSSFSLSLLEKISETRRSGLTFAVETPLDFWQIAINKQVSRDSVTAILKEAKKNGWRGAKFYFMIGLPESGGGNEETAIVDFIADVGRRTGVHCTINVGIFVPKPHTPYQWSAQISSETAAIKLDYIRSKLKPLGHKVSVSDTLVSLIEGVLSRGDERAGPLIEAAWQGGSRLDAWQEFINRDAWLAILKKNQQTAAEFLMEKDANLPLPWRSIVSGVSAAYLRKEKGKSEQAECSPPCMENCADVCGVCGANRTVTKAEKSLSGKAPVPPEQNAGQPERTEGKPQSGNKTDPSIWRMLFSFCKEESAVLHGHLSLLEIFSMAFNRAALPILYTQGFNPLVKLEIAAPLTTGIKARAELAIADFAEPVSPAEFREKLNRNLPGGIAIQQAALYLIPGGHKKHSLASLLWGFQYDDGSGGITTVKTVEDKPFRQKMAAGGVSLFDLRRLSVLAKMNNAEGGASYFDVYDLLYPQGKSTTSP